MTIKRLCYPGHFGQSHFDQDTPDSEVNGANMGPIWGRQDEGGPHVGPMIIWDIITDLQSKHVRFEYIHIIPFDIMLIINMAIFVKQMRTVNTTGFGGESCNLDL